MLFCYFTSSRTEHKKMSSSSSSCFANQAGRGGFQEPEVDLSATVTLHSSAVQKRRSRSPKARGAGRGSSPRPPVGLANGTRGNANGTIGDNVNYGPPLGGRGASPDQEEIRLLHYPERAEGGGPLGRSSPRRRGISPEDARLLLAEKIKSVSSRSPSPGARKGPCSPAARRSKSPKRGGGGAAAGAGGSKKKNQNVGGAAGSKQSVAGAGAGGNNNAGPPGPGSEKNKPPMFRLVIAGENDPPPLYPPPGEQGDGDDLFSHVRDHSASLQEAGGGGGRRNSKTSASLSQKEQVQGQQHPTKNFYSSLSGGSGPERVLRGRELRDYERYLQQREQEQQLQQKRLREAELLNRINPVPSLSDRSPKQYLRPLSGRAAMSPRSRYIGVSMSPSSNLHQPGVLGSNASPSAAVVHHPGDWDSDTKVPSSTFSPVAKLGKSPVLLAHSPYANTPAPPASQMIKNAYAAPGQQRSPPLMNQQLYDDPSSGLGMFSPSPHNNGGNNMHGGSNYMLPPTSPRPQSPLLKNQSAWQAEHDKNVFLSARLPSPEMRRRYLQALKYEAEKSKAAARELPAREAEKLDALQHKRSPDKPPSQFRKPYLGQEGEVLKQVEEARTKREEEKKKAERLYQRLFAKQNEKSLGAVNNDKYDFTNLQRDLLLDGRDEDTGTENADNGSTGEGYPGTDEDEHVEKNNKNKNAKNKDISSSPRDPDRRLSEDELHHKAVKDNAADKKKRKAMKKLDKEMERGPPPIETWSSAAAAARPTTAAAPVKRAEFEPSDLVESLGRQARERQMRDNGDPGESLETVLAGVRMPPPEQHASRGRSGAGKMNKGGGGYHGGGPVPVGLSPTSMGGKGGNYDYNEYDPNAADVSAFNHLHGPATWQTPDLRQQTDFIDYPTAEERNSQMREAAEINARLKHRQQSRRGSSPKARKDHLLSDADIQKRAKENAAKVRKEMWDEPLLVEKRKLEQQIAERQRLEEERRAKMRENEKAENQRKLKEKLLREMGGAMEGDPRTGMISLDRLESPPPPPVARERRGSSPSQRKSYAAIEQVHHNNQMAVKKSDASHTRGRSPLSGAGNLLTGDYRQKKGSSRSRSPKGTRSPSPGPRSLRPLHTQDRADMKDERRRSLSPGRLSPRSKQRVKRGQRGGTRTEKRCAMRYGMGAGDDDGAYLDDDDHDCHGDASYSFNHPGGNNSHSLLEDNSHNSYNSGGGKQGMTEAEEQRHRELSDKQKHIERLIKEKKREQKKLEEEHKRARSRLLKAMDAATHAGLSTVPTRNKHLQNKGMKVRGPHAQANSPHLVQQSDTILRKVEQLVSDMKGVGSVMDVGNAHLHLRDPQAALEAERRFKDEHQSAREVQQTRRGQDNMILDTIQNNLHVKAGGLRGRPKHSISTRSPTSVVGPSSTSLLVAAPSPGGMIASSPVRRRQSLKDPLSPLSLPSTSSPGKRGNHDVATLVPPRSDGQGVDDFPGEGQTSDQESDLWATRIKQEPPESAVYNGLHFDEVGRFSYLSYEQQEHIKAQTKGLVVSRELEGVAFDLNIRAAKDFVNKEVERILLEELKAAEDLIQGRCTQTTINSGKNTRPGTSAPPPRPGTAAAVRPGTSAARKQERRGDQHLEAFKDAKMGNTAQISALVAKTQQAIEERMGLGGDGRLFDDSSCTEDSASDVELHQKYNAFHQGRSTGQANSTTQRAAASKSPRHATRPVVASESASASDSSSAWANPAQTILSHASSSSEGVDVNNPHKISKSSIKYKVDLTSGTAIVDKVVGKGVRAFSRMESLQQNASALLIQHQWRKRVKALNKAVLPRDADGIFEVG
ncbi:unnamed protein product [Amoebophrya sp. A25]|nr:unnamed protein product [Amoebophrya sp. A25]|eukprot:GSA25T00003760001.1